MEIGIDSFVATTGDPVTGAKVDPVVRLRNLLEEVEMAAGSDSMSSGSVSTTARSSSIQRPSFCWQQQQLVRSEFVWRVP